MPTAITPRIRKVPDMDHAQHKVLWALSVIEEEGLKTFFRAIREGAVRPPLVDEVNAELDKNIGFEEMFKSSPAIRAITGNDCIELEVMWSDGDICWIRVGLMGYCGPGAQWKVRFGPEGDITELKVDEIWGAEVENDSILL